MESCELPSKASRTNACGGCTVRMEVSGGILYTAFTGTPHLLAGWQRAKKMTKNRASEQAGQDPCKSPPRWVPIWFVSPANSAAQHPLSTWAPICSLLQTFSRLTNHRHYEVNQVFVPGASRIISYWSYAKSGPVHTAKSVCLLCCRPYLLRPWTIRLQEDVRTTFTRLWTRGWPEHSGAQAHTRSLPSC